MSKLLTLVEKSRRRLNLIHFANDGNKSFLPRENFQVEFNPSKWGRKTDERLEMQIEQIWEEKRTTNRVYNGTKFRLGAIDIPDLATVNLYLGLTCYKDILGTSQSPIASHWQEKGKIEARNSRAFMSDGLGVGVLAFTSDGYLILIRRALWTGEYPGMIDRPGGHPEPDHVLISGSEKGDMVADEVVAKEVWDSPVQELESETGIVRGQIGDHKLMGLVRNQSLWGRPSLEFETRVSISADRVRSQFDLQQHAEANESSELVLVPPDEVRHLLHHPPLGPDHGSEGRNTGEASDTLAAKDFVKEFTPALQGALTLYGSTELED